MELDRHPDADRHARDGGWLLARRLRQIDGPVNMPATSFLDRRSGAHGLLGRGGRLRAVSGHTYPRPKRIREPHAHAYDSRLYRALRSTVRWSIRHRWLVITATIASFAAAIAGMAFVQHQFFRPHPGRNCSSKSACPKARRSRPLQRLRPSPRSCWPAIQYVVTYTTYVGQGSPRFFLALNPVLPNPSFALTVIMTQNAEARNA